MRIRSPMWKMLAALLVIIIAIWAVAFDHQKRLDSRRVQCASNLSTIGFALHQYLRRNGTFPADIQSPTNERLLSWRVELLSVLDPALYDRFDLKQAWDSEPNLKLMKRMPIWYSCPSDEEGKSRHTASYYRVVQPNQPTDDQESPLSSLRPQMDAECILLVESSDLKIPWTQPGDFPGDPCSDVLINADQASSACQHPGSPYVIKVNCQREALRLE